MKKFLSVFIALAMALSLFAGVGARTAKAAAGAATVTVGTATMAAGGHAVIDVTATVPAGSDIGTMQFTLTYDGTKISALAAGVTAGGLTSTFLASNPDVNTLNVGGLAPDLTTGVAGSTVVLAHVTIQALAGLTAGTSTPITLTVTTLADHNAVAYAPITATSSTATVNVAPPITLPAGVISNTLTATPTSVVAGAPVTVTDTIVYGDMSAYPSDVFLDELVTLSQPFTSNVTVTTTYGTFTVVAGTTQFWAFGGMTGPRTVVAHNQTGATATFTMSFTPPSTTSISAQLIAATQYGFTYPNMWSVISTASASVTVSANVLTIANMVDPTLLYNGLPSYIYLQATNPDDSAATGLATFGTFTFSGATVAPINVAVTELVAGSGLYQIALTPQAVGSLILTVKNTVSGATATIWYNVLAQSAVWNPTVSFTLGAPALAIGGTAQFTGNYNVGGSYYLEDHKTAVTGPKFSSTSHQIRSGGQFVVTMNANVWVAGKTALNATPIYGTQVFKITPVVTGDVVTVDPTTVNVGDTKDVSVTVMQASGIERNNGLVTLSAATGTFTVPTGAVYTLVDDGTTATVTMDASHTYPYNLNIVGGKYLFAGLKFNHAGTVTVKTYDTTGAKLTSIGFITVNPRVHALTADFAKFVAGVAYPVVNVTGGVTGLGFTGAYDDSGNAASLGLIDKGDGSYVFNVAAVADESGVTYTGTKAALPDDEYVLAMPIVKPTLTITSVHADGLITDSLAETVKFTLTDPVTGDLLTVTSKQLAVQYTTWAVTGNNNLAVSSLAGALANVSATLAVASTGNPNLDTTVDKPYVSIVGTVNGQVITYADALLVSPAIITVAPKDLVLFYNQSNMFSVNALDAHKGAIAGATIYGENYFLQTIPTTEFGGVTGADGTVAFQYVPNYIGQIDIVSSLSADPYVVQIVPAPADTTAPVITVTAGIDGSTVAADTLKLTGSVDEKVSALYVGFNKVDVLPDGSFMTTVKLVAGENTIDIVAYDLAGNKGTKSIKVTFTAAAAKTVIMLTIGTDVVTVNGKATSIDAVPEIVNGRTFVPIRFIAETFGATVDWLAETQGITVTLGDSTIGLQIGNATAVIDGNIISLEAAPYIKNGRTMVPLRVISEAFGGDVAWDPALRTITISY